jgi:SAM-dependent methyltransferase
MARADAEHSGDVVRVELTEREIAVALRDPRAARELCLRRARGRDDVAHCTSDSRLYISRPSPPLVLPTPSELWYSELDSVVLATAEELVELLGSFRPEPLCQHISVLSQEALRSYLLMNVVRVVRCVEALRRRGLESGRVLEVGAWFGSFALAFQRLGYEVVACDRYPSYGRAFDRYVDLMEQEGVKIAVTTRENELEEIRSFGLFDAVVAAAVIEHVPHTPRHLLARLFEAVHPGGHMVVDTPNLARYWNRRVLERGETIFQPLEDQFACEPPWEGHHREYTASELEWMLRRVGCVDVDVEFVDYNLLQFEELPAEHIECLATIVEEPSQSDIILGVGRRPTSPGVA